MEEKVFEYVFSRNDYDESQKSFWSKDIFGSSSWKGEEKIVLYKDRIETYINGNLDKKHALLEFESFYDGSLSETHDQVLLIKKLEYLTFTERNIIPVFSTSNNFINIRGDFVILLKQSLVITFRKRDERERFRACIEKLLPRAVNDPCPQSYSTSNNMRKRDIYWISFLLVAISLALVLGILLS